MTNETQKTNHWILDSIVSIGKSISKPSRDYFCKFFLGALIKPFTVSKWIRCTSEEKRYKKYYQHLQCIGKQLNKLQGGLVNFLLQYIPSLFAGCSRIVLVADDSPIKRSGSKIEGAGWIHDPTSKNVKATTCYGHSLVVLSLVLEHPKWGTISVPLMHRLYIKKNDLDKIDEKKRPEFRTKLQLLIKMLQEICPKLHRLNKPILLLFDRGYVSSEVFKATATLEREKDLEGLGVKIVTRFKSNVNFYKKVEPSDTVKRGRPKKYGDSLKAEDIMNDEKIDLVTKSITMYGGSRLVEFKTIVLTSRITDSQEVRIVVSRLIKETKGKNGKIYQKVGSLGIFVSTDLDMTPEEILVYYSKRFSIEEMFKDMKDVGGLGKQQVRNLESNLGCIEVVSIVHTLVEIWAWDQDEAKLKSSRSPWDNKERRPSHRDKRTALQFEICWSEFSREYAESIKPEILKHLKKSLFSTVLSI